MISPVPIVPLTATARLDCSQLAQRTAPPWRRPLSFPNATALLDTSEPISTNVCCVLLDPDVPIIRYPRALLGLTLILEALTAPCVPLGPLETSQAPQNAKCALVV